MTSREAFEVYSARRTPHFIAKHSFSYTQAPRFSREQSNMAFVYIARVLLFGMPCAHAKFKSFSVPLVTLLG